MIEGLKIIKKSFHNKKVNFNGKFYKIKNFICSPKPVKKIPIWLGEADNNLMIKEIVKNADYFNSMPCSIEVYKAKIKKIKKESFKQKRDFNKIGQSLETQILIGKDDLDLRNKIKKIISLKKINKNYDKDLMARLLELNRENIDYESLEKLKEEFFVGTLKEIKQKINKFRNEGVDHFMFWPMDFPNNYTINKLIKNIIN